MAKKPPEQKRAEELTDFLQDYALGKRDATEQEVEAAQKELDELLSDEEE
ncbi:MAG: hypothetical protein ACLQO1_01625 [Steroidobacteraceae bacterium]